MKIREVCRKTGLTERTVRFWAGQGLISPETYEMNGRSYFVFSREDVAALEEIDTLRRAGFSLAQVQQMRAQPDSTAAAAAQLLEELKRRQEETEASLAALASAADCQSPGELARQLRTYAARRPLPEANPRFGRFDAESREEKERAYAAFQSGSARRSRQRQRLRTAFGALALVLLSAVLTLALSGQLRRSPEPPAPDWQQRLSGDYDPAVDCRLPGLACLEGRDGATGRMTRVYETEQGEAVFSWYRLSPTEQELLEALEGPVSGQRIRWQEDTAMGPGAALCRLPAGDGGVYTLHVLCAHREGLLAVLPQLQLRVEGSPVSPDEA